jgi:hypothetical protein
MGPVEWGLEMYQGKERVKVFTPAAAAIEREAREVGAS